MSYKNGNYANYTRKYWNISQSDSGVLGVATNVSKKKNKKKKNKKKKKKTTTTRNTLFI